MGFWGSSCVSLSIIVLGCRAFRLAGGAVGSVFRCRCPFRCRVLMISGTSDSSDLTHLGRCFRSGMAFVTSGSGGNFTTKGGRTLEVTGKGCILLLGSSAVI